MIKDYTNARVFLARVLPWPQDASEQAYCNLHYTFTPSDPSTLRKDKSGNPIMPWSGRACRSLDEIVNALQWLHGQPSTKDMYFCTSSQMMAEERTGRTGKVWNKAVRSQQNAGKSKVLFLDIDLKGGEHGYDTKEELLAAFAKFIKATGLPKPSIIIYSGGGYHFYWTLMDALEPDEWKKLAFALANATKQEGLKCDGGVTVDIARILRVPQTLNHKYDPPREVTFASKPVEYDYPNEKIAAALKPYEVVVPYSISNPSMAILPPKPPLQGVSEMEMGIESKPPIDVGDLIPECGFIADAIADGGKTYTNPMWNLTTLVAVFTKDGRVDAHRMAHGHPGYTPAETDALFDRKEREKQEKNLGWPKCVSISNAGCTACATCKHFPKGMSPLNFAVPAQTAAQAQVTSQSNVPAQQTYIPGTGKQDPDLPKGFLRNSDGIILYPQVLTDGSTQWVPISDFPMKDAWIQEEGYLLCFMTTVNSGRTQKQIIVPSKETGSSDLRKVLHHQGFMVEGGNRAAQILGEFLVKWITQLQSIPEKVVENVPYGWVQKNGTPSGFSYGGRKYTPAGEELAPSSDEQTLRTYSPSGDRQPWLDAVKLITDQKRPALNAMLSTAFGAPLVGFTGHKGLLMSAYSVASGIGKTSTMTVAQAVWGSPRYGLQGVNDTTNSVMHKIGTLRSLPLYWDELKTAEDGKKFVNLVFQLDKGADKSRLNQNVTQRERGVWNTIMLIATNESMSDHISAVSRTNAASHMRLFEFDVPKPKPGDPGQLDLSIASRMLGKLDDNYGHVGAEYAQWLGQNFKQIDKEVAAMWAAINKAVAAKQEERLWTALIACSVLGAKYANDLGYTNIDTRELMLFLRQSLETVRRQVITQPVDMNQEINVVNVLARYINEKRSRNTLMTNIMHKGRGRPTNGSVTIRGDPTRMEGIHIHVSTDDKVLRIGQGYFQDWLRSNNFMVHVIMRALEDKMGAKTTNAKLGAGTAYAGGTERVYEIDLTASPFGQHFDPQ